VRAHALEHGVLRLELPKAVHARPRTIKVSAHGRAAAGAGSTATETK
jgi:hypothetical protein